MALFAIWPGSTAIALSRSSENQALHYRPLGDVSLRELAARKIHHGKNGRYLNPLGELHRKRRFRKLLYWKLFDENRFKKFLEYQQIVPVKLNWKPVKTYGGASVTFIKHASVLIREGNQQIIVDPVFDGLFWFIKDFTPLTPDLKDMPVPNHVLITHGHYDHISKDTLAKFDPGTHVISPLGYDDIFSGLKMHNRTQLDWYDSHRGGRFEVILLPCNHWTMRDPLKGPNLSLWGSYLIRTEGGKTIYVSGDTGYFDGFEDIGNEFDIDLAIFNLGAYEPRWFMAPSHINPTETVRAFKELRADRLMIVHWGTFQLGDEPVHFPPFDLRRELEKEGLLDRWVRLSHGETHFL